MTGAIQPPRQDWKKQSLGFKWRGSVRGEVYFFVYFSSQHMLKITPLMKKPREQASVNAFSYYQHSSILRQISLTNQKH